MATGNWDRKQLARDIEAAITGNPAYRWGALAAAEARAAYQPPADATIEQQLGAFHEALHATAPVVDRIGQATETEGEGVGGDIADMTLDATAPDGLRAIVNEFSGTSSRAQLEFQRFTDDPAWQGEIERNWLGLADVAARQVADGLARGLGVQKVSRVLVNAINDLPAYAAENLVRTVYMQSMSRAEAARYTEAVADLPIRRVIRIATLDRRTCMACLSRHGEVIWEGAGAVPQVVDHHQGRCSAVTEWSGAPLEIETGESYFRGLPDDEQRNWMGPRKWEAWRGGEIRFADFPQRYDNDLYGEMMREKSLRAMRDGN